jgi:hypothetical protein
MLELPPSNEDAAPQIEGGGSLISESKKLFVPDDDDPCLSQGTEGVNL